MRIEILTILLAFGLLACSDEIKQDTGPARGPGRQSDLECLGKLRPRQSEEISGSMWGISCHWIVDPHELTAGQQVDQLAQLGAKWGFLCPDWNRIESEEGKYDFNTPDHPLDEAVNAMIKRKITPIIQIYGGNQMYMPVAPDPNNRQMADASLLLDDPVVRQAWHRYIEAMAERYKESVKFWEIWNEPNSDYFWQRDGAYFRTPVSDYGRIVKEVAAIIRSVQPDAVIIAGSTATVHLEYLEDFLSSEGTDFFDYWSVHPYGELPEARDDEIRRAQKILEVHGKSAVMWQSECGFPSDKDTGGWGWGGPWDETKHAKWVLRRLLSDAAAGMQASVYFVLNDYPALLELGPDKGKMGINRKGLHYFGSWEPKPAAFAFQNLAGLVDNRMVQEPYDVSMEIVSPGSTLSLDNIRTYTLKDRLSGSPVVVYWLAVPMVTDFTAQTVRITLPEETIDQPVLVDLLDGRVYEVPVNHEGSALFEELPLADSPLILCNRRLVELIPESAK
ncbi:MAG: cellulase family glycosylhydrolase [Bacteroidota bacterium]